MDIEEQQRRVISEQRDQLMQLRATLKKLKEQPQGSEQAKDLGPVVLELMEKFYPKPSGTTIGIQVPPGMRARLFAQVERRRPAARNYGHVILVCIELGLQSLERSTDAERPVEEVQRVLGPDDSGHGTDSAPSEQVSRGTSLLANHQG